jgi:oxygen-independent coproporphyrinogen-3 oxidase
LESFGKSLETAVGMHVTHVSCYALTVEGGTPLAADKALLAALPDETLDRAMYALAKEKLKAAGFRHYEISNWAKEGFECYHNLGYWTNREYLGFGLGASSYFKSRRFKKTDDLEAYINGDFKFAHSEDITVKAQMAEFVVLGLRLIEGINTKAFKARFGKDIFHVFKAPLAKFLAQGLLTHRSGNIALTPLGLDLSNMIFMEFL